MRILVCGINYAPDLIGIAKYNTELCEALSAFGHDVHVVTAPPYYPKWEIPPAYQTYFYRLEEIAGIRVRRAPIYVPKIPSGSRRVIHHCSFALTSALPIISQALRWRPHLMLSVAPSLLASAFVATAARWTGAYSWLHLQDFEVDAAFGLGLLGNKRLRQMMVGVERKILRSFDRVSTIAPEMLQRLAYKGVDTNRLREVRNWVDASEILPGDRQTSFRTQLSLGDNALVALYAGSMSNKQGLELVIEAAREIADSHPQIHFVMSGDGPRKAELQSMASDLRNVHFLPVQTNNRFTELLNTADMHLIPQKAEAADLVLPSKLGGIFASGRPVIAMAAPRTGLAQEVEGAGIIVSPGDVRALAAGVRTLADNAELRHVFGTNGRRRALERWDKGPILDFLNQEFLALCHDNQVPPELASVGTRVGRPTQPGAT